MTKKILTSIIVLSLILSCCTKTHESLASREVIDGIEHVRNAPEPRYLDKTLTLEEELAIGGEDQEGNVILFDAGYVLVDDAENIWIVDRRDFNIKVFDPEGGFVRSVGKQGEGPGEFQQVGYVTFLPDGRLLVMDFQASRTSLFDKAGGFISSHQWTKRISRLILATNTSYFAQELVMEEGADPLAERKLVVNKFDLEGNQVLSFGGFKLPEFKTLRDGDIMFGMSVPHSPQSIFASDIKNQCFYHCLTDKYLIEIYDTEGNVFRTIERPYDPLPYTSQDKDKYLERYRDRGDERQTKMVEGMDFPSVKTITDRILVDDEGYLWLQTHELREEGDAKLALYDIFSNDGTYVMQIWLEVRPDVIKNGKMYIHYTDEDTGYTYIKRFKMIWSE
jgi:hypothetical protein